MTRALLRSIKITLPAAVASTALLIVALGCSGGSADNASPVVQVQTVTARRQSIDDIVTAQGLVYPIHQASITPKITAPVERFYVNRGSQVHAGQLLAVLANQDLAGNLVAARGAYDQALGNYQSTTASTLPEEIQAAKNTLENAKANLQQQKQLYDSDTRLYKAGAIARKVLEAAGVALTNAKSTYQNAKTRLQNLQASGESAQQRAAKGQLESAHGKFLNAQAQLAYTHIRSPIKGVVADRAVYPGNVAPAGVPLLTVMDTSKIIVRLHIPQVQATQLKLGDPASVKIPGTSTTLPGKVTILSPALDPNSTTLQVWVQATNPHGALQPGTSVSVSITGKKIPNAIVVPDPAILTNAAGKSRVMVVGSDSIAKSRPVTTGIQQGNLIQVLTGLQSGQQVIVTGAFGLPDKTKVKAHHVTFKASQSSSDSSQ